MEERKVTISWIPNNFDKEYFTNIFGYLMNPDEYLSNKLKNMKLDQRYFDDDKLPKYVISLAEAKKCFNNSITVFKLKNDVIEKIKNTKIEKMPNEIPEIFLKPFIIEAFDDNDVLFGDINSIMGYFSSYSQQLLERTEDSSGNTIIGTKNQKSLDEKTFSLIIHSNNKENKWQDSADQLNNRKEISGFVKYLGYNIFEWQPYLQKTDWEFTKKNYERNILIKEDFCKTCFLSKKCEKDDLYKLKENYNFCFDGMCDNIISFLTVLNFMLIAENTPIVVDKQKSKVERIKRDKRNKIVKLNEEWIIRYLYIDKTKSYYEKQTEYTRLEKDGYVLKDVKVRGHLRNQAFGEGFKLRRWIYIESFISSKWMKEGDVKIIVS